jgi:glucose-6-phosphate 1-dehydrogenase
METPKSFEAIDVRTERAKVLKSLTSWTTAAIKKQTKRGQYEGYLEVDGVKADSQTETYFRLETSIDNKRWKGVPFILESGKSLAESKAEVVVTFKHKDPCLCPPSGHVTNVLKYEIQPEERIRISLWVKRPGFDMKIEEKDFSFDYHAAYSDMSFVDPKIHPYLKLLLDAMNGNQTLFVSTDEIKASWKFIDPIQAEWKKGEPELGVY